VYSSQTGRGLSASLSWYDLKISNYIAAPDLRPLSIIPISSRVQSFGRLPRARFAQGFLGVITQFNGLNYNFGDLRVSGFDADVSYAVETRLGTFTPSLAVANIYRWTSALAPAAPVVDGLSQATLFGVGWAPVGKALPRSRGNAAHSP